MPSTPSYNVWESISFITDCARRPTQALRPMRAASCWRDMPHVHPFRDLPVIASASILSIIGVVPS